MADEEVEVVPGVVGPRERVLDWVTLWPGGQEMQAVVTFDVELRKYVCHQVMVRRGEVVVDGQMRPGEPVTTEVLREVAVSELVSGMTRIDLLVDRHDGRALRELPNPDGREPWGRTLPADLKSAGPTDRTLRWVAHLYRLGVALGEPPTKTVQEAFALPRTTAVRWVMAARNRQFLGAAEVGKAGEKS